MGYEFEERPDGLRGLEAAYGLKFNGRRAPWTWGCCIGRLTQRQVDIIAGNSTDGPIQAVAPDCACRRPALFSAL